MRIVVDLPAPLGPRKPTTWPRSTAKETWSTAVTPPNRLETPSRERKGIGGEMLTAPRRFLQAPAWGRFLQRLKEGDERRAVGGRKRLETVARTGALAPVQLDGLLERGRPAVVQEMLGAAQVEERLGTKVRRGGEAEADIGQVGPHVVQQEVGVGGERLVPQGRHGAVPGAQRRDVTGRAPDLGEEVAAVPSVFAELQRRGRREEAHEVVGEVERVLADLRIGRGVHTRGDRLPPDVLLGGLLGVGDAHLRKAFVPALNSRNVGTKALRPNRPMR